MVVIGIFYYDICFIFVVLGDDFGGMFVRYVYLLDFFVELDFYVQFFCYVDYVFYNFVYVVYRVLGVQCYIGVVYYVV